MEKEKVPLPTSPEQPPQYANGYAVSTVAEYVVSSEQTPMLPPPEWTPGPSSAFRPIPVAVSAPQAFTVHTIDEKHPQPHPPVMATPVVRQVPISPSPSQVFTTFYTFIMNVGWAFLGFGILFFMLYVAIGLILCLTLIGAPLGLQLFRYSLYVLAPYGRHPHDRKPCDCVHASLSLIWAPFGLVLYVVHLAAGVFYFITLIFLPFGLMHFKLAALSWFPFGYQFSDHPMTASSPYKTDYYFENGLIFPPKAPAVTISNEVGAAPRYTPTASANV